MWSFVGSKDNDQWLWLMYLATRQILAFHVGKRNKDSGEALMMKKLPEDLKKSPLYTDKFSVYYEIIPWTQHSVVSKESEKTSYIERFNCTIRHRCSRLVRKASSFSKKIENHMDIIKMFICDYNKNLKSLPVQDYPSTYNKANDTWTDAEIVVNNSSGEYGIGVDCLGQGIFIYLEGALKLRVIYIRVLFL